jgi:carbon-monoxide dehydrogenase small subunit
MTVNGEKVSVRVEDHWTLLRLLREALALAGTKEGCGKGECGACTVILDGRPVNSCLTLAVEAEGCDVVTIEGEARLFGSASGGVGGTAAGGPTERATGSAAGISAGAGSSGGISRLQQAFIDHGAFQCGFCTAGAIMSARALLMRNPDPTEEEVREAISGNLCRCTGYTPIVEAVLDAAWRERGEECPRM